MEPGNEAACNRRISCNVCGPRKRFCKQLTCAAQKPFTLSVCKFMILQDRNTDHTRVHKHVFLSESPLATHIFVIPVVVEGSLAPVVVAAART